MADKRMTEDEAIATLSSGMTIGIGGWGSRRKPMALVRAILRSDLTDLTVVSYGGPDVGLLAAAGKIRRLVYGFVSLDSIALEPHFRMARQTGTIPEVRRARRGHVPVGPQGCSLPAALPADPRRARLRRAGQQPVVKTHRPYDPYADGEELLAVPALTLDAAFVHLNRADRRGNAQFLGPDLYFDDLFLHGRRARPSVSVEQSVVATEDRADRGHLPHPADQPLDGRRRDRGAQRRALHQLPAGLRA